MHGSSASSNLHSLAGLPNTSLLKQVALTRYSQGQNGAGAIFLGMRKPGYALNFDACSPCTFLPCCRSWMTLHVRPGWGLDLCKCCHLFTAPQWLIGHSDFTNKATFDAASQCAYPAELVDEHPQPSGRSGPPASTSFTQRLCQQCDQHAVVVKCYMSIERPAVHVARGKYAGLSVHGASEQAVIHNNSCPC